MPKQAERKENLHPEEKVQFAVGKRRKDDIPHRKKFY